MVCWDGAECPICGFWCRLLAVVLSIVIGVAWHATLGSICKAALGAVWADCVAT